MFSTKTLARTGLALATLGLSAAALVGTAGQAQATSPTYQKSHTVTASFQFNVHQNNLFHKADASSYRTGTQSIHAGEANPTSYLGNVFVTSKQADDTYGTDNLYVTETDSTGTVHVKDRQTLSFYWHGSTVTSAVDVDIAPNTTRSFWAYTDGAGGDYEHTLVTVTNAVS